MLKSALMLLVNPLMVFSDKAKYIESNKDAIKRCLVTSLTHFM